MRVTSDARKHKVTRTRIEAALSNATFIGAESDRELYIGVDDLGVELEMVLVPDDRNPDGMACIHAMPLHYREKEE